MSTLCISCRSTQIESQCGVCNENLCKKCRIFLPEGEFAFASKLPEDLRHTYYCGNCDDQIVEPFREKYQATLEQAKNVNIIYANSKSVVRILKKAQKPIQVASLPDRDEAILRLAFQAAQDGFNAVIEVEITTQKIRDEGWQKQAWSARGIPAEITSYELGRKT